MYAPQPGAAQPPFLSPPGCVQLPPMVALPPPQPAFATVVCTPSPPRWPVLFQLAAPPNLGCRCAGVQLLAGTLQY